MARLDDLAAQIRDRELRRKFEDALSDMKRRQRFGLVFEEHVPETTTNLTTVDGEVIDFTQTNPYAGLKGKPLWPMPESPSANTLINPTGARGGLLGNLGLTTQDEANLVAFLRTLSDVPSSSGH